jgi:hypothetical protein
MKTPKLLKGQKAIPFLDWFIHHKEGMIQDFSAVADFLKQPFNPDTIADYFHMVDWDMTIVEDTMGENKKIKVGCKWSNYAEEIEFDYINCSLTLKTTCHFPTFSDPNNEELIEVKTDIPKTLNEFVYECQKASIYFNFC